jgi:hypothetical protein
MNPCDFVDLVTLAVQARYASFPTDQLVFGWIWIGTISPQTSGANMTSPGPVYLLSDISPPVIILLNEIFIEPLI